MKSRDRKSQKPDTTDLDRAARWAQWEDAPPSCLEAASRIPRDSGQDMAPPATSRAHIAPWQAPDVRAVGVETAAAGNARSVVHAFDGGELALVATPPRGDTRWKVQGSFWLRTPSREPIRVLWLHGEHVLATVAAADGDLFEMEAFVSAGWTLEVHLPDGLVLEIPEPIA